MDYSVFIKDLQEQRVALMAKLNAIDAAIEGAKILAGQNLENTTTVGSSEQATAVKRGTGELSNMSIPHAAEVVIRKHGRVMRTRELGEAMLAGGFESDAANFFTTLGSVLSRHSKEVGRVVRMEGGWGLPEFQKQQEIGSTAA